MVNVKFQEDFDICIGVITSANGVKGYVKILSFTADSADIDQFRNIFDDQKKSYSVKVIVRKKDYVIASIEGIDSRNLAERFRNKRLYIKRSELPKISNDEFYHADLIGIEVKLLDGSKFGKVKNIVNFGAGDIIEIYSFAKESTIYYPFTKQFVPTIDIAGGCIILEPIEELTTDNE